MNFISEFLKIQKLIWRLCIMTSLNSALLLTYLKLYSPISKEPFVSQTEMSIKKDGVNLTFKGT